MIIYREGLEMKKSNMILIALMALGLVMYGCSFSDSSRHSSRSSTSPSRSSARAGEQKVHKVEQNYQDDVAALTLLYIGSEGSSVDFQRELGQISKSYGIVDWENAPETFIAIGTGLKRGMIPVGSIESLPFLEGLTEGQYYSQIMQGYR